MSDIRVFVNSDLLCGESPMWEAETQRLLYVDSDRTFVYAADQEGKVSVLSDDIQVSSVVFAQDGYVLLGDGVWKMDRAGKKQQILSEYDGEKLFFNDCIAGPDGSIYAGSYYWNENGMAKAGNLYRLTKDKAPVVLDTGIELSNGLGFSPDNDTLYYSDSAKKCIYKYDFDAETGSVSNKSIFARSENGIPDGLTVDSEGYVWCAMWYDGTVYRFDPDGKVERILEFPVKQVASVMFGGKDLSTLYVSTASGLFESHMMPKNFDRSAELGGKIYCKETDIIGKIENKANY